MASLPDFLNRPQHVDLEARSPEPWLRRLALLVLAGVIAAALANVFGQNVEEKAVEAPAASLTVRAPDALRGGLIYQAAFRIDARRELKQPALVLDPGWFEGMTLNSVNPEPVGWAQRDGRNVLVFGRIPAGAHLVVRLQFQVNPTSWGRRDENVVLEDGEEHVASLAHAVRIYP